MDKKNIILIILLVCILALFGYFLFNSPKSTPQTGFRPVEIQGSLLEVKDQQQIDVVYLNTVLKKDGFITIHRTMSEAPAEIIGTSSFIKSGEYNDLKIDLDTDMLPGFRYVALLHVDNGDGEYVVLDDFPVQNEGVVVKDYFLAIPEAERFEFPGQETVEVQR